MREQSDLGSLFIAGGRHTAINNLKHRSTSVNWSGELFQDVRCTYLDECAREKIKICNVEVPDAQNVKAGAIFRIQLQCLQNVVLDIS